jgi:hypothetical protein
MNMQLSIRQQIEAEVERLICLLDRLDGDTDLEPSLAGYSEGMDDREGDEEREEACEDEGAQCDDEGDINDSGIGDNDGLLEQYFGRYGTGSGQSGFAVGVE